MNVIKTRQSNGRLRIRINDPASVSYQAANLLVYGRQEGGCLTFKESEFKPVDIYMMPSAYPGYVSGKDSKPLWETSTNFTAFVDAQKQAAKNPGVSAAAVTEASAKGSAAAQAATAPAPKVETATPTVAAPSVPQTPQQPALPAAPLRPRLPSRLPRRRPSRRRWVRSSRRASSRRATSASSWPG